jgi:hypothetical protein
MGYVKLTNPLEEENNQSVASLVAGAADSPPIDTTELQGDQAPEFGEEGQDFPGRSQAFNELTQAIDTLEKLTHTDNKGLFRSRLKTRMGRKLRTIGSKSLFI